ncbi:YeiH family protein [Mycetocola zhadangensis]|uniref:Putative sulfate exporter family transporter n=1 Tax=Mycetocola zhadangensis TaxID=1164595 RepID=A0A3L7J4I6_9MICO|nr:putative sulfate exporter family transporter [Mycetocola zhadangensis]RLQ85596.1 putative sulfate exporter family transporter [Mycetocola zhadangensis]GGE83979.1 membrane protein [Mycetocola zhadangensis]
MGVTLTRAAWLPGVAVAAGAAAVALAVSALFPAVPLLTAAVVLGILVAQLPAAQSHLRGSLAPGLALSSRRFMRIGVVLLGFKLSLVDVASLGWGVFLSTVAIVLITFGGTWLLGRVFRLPGHEPLLLATGFAICGASAIGAMSGVVRAKSSEQAHPVALVTLCGTLAIVVLPALWHPLALDNLQFGHWVGASVHDVGQVVATAQIAGSSALAVALVVKLTRVVLLAPIVAVAAVVERRRFRPNPDAAKPPLVPLFVVGFLAAILLRTFLVIPEPVLSTIDGIQTALLAMALFGLGAAVNLRRLVTTGWRALAVGLLSWALIAVLALAAVHLFS